MVVAGPLGTNGSNKGVPATLGKSLFRLSQSSEELSRVLSEIGSTSVSDAAISGGMGAAGGAGGAPPHGGPPIAAGAPDPGGEDRNNVVILLLQEIRDAVKALHEAMGVSPYEEKLKDPSSRDITEEALFGEKPSTNIGKFAHRARGIYRRFKSRFKNVAGLFARRKKGATGGLAGAAGGGGGGGGAGAIGGAAGALPGAAGGIAAGGSLAGIAMSGVAVFAAAAVEFGKAVYDFARAQEKEMRRLAEVGADQSVAAAQLDAERTLRDIKTAEETGGSSRSLADSINAFEDAFRPIESLITNISNTVAGRLLDIATGVLDAVNPIVEVLTDIYNALPGKKMDKDKLPNTNWEILKQIEAERMKIANPQWPGAVQVGPRGGAMPFGGGI